MMTGVPYRGTRLTRVLDKGGWTELWTVGEDKRPLSWNDAIATVDATLPEPPPERVTCSKCGDIDLLSWDKGLRARLIDRSVCFNCDFWLNRAEIAKDPMSAIVAGTAYFVEPDRRDHQDWAGFGGRRFDIEWFDGRKVTTHNLWHQGTVPERFRDLIPDNARFARKEDQQ